MPASGAFFGKQCVATLIAAVYSYVVSALLLLLIGLVIRLKPTKEEIADLDKAFHGESAYLTSDFSVHSAHALGPNGNGGSSTTKMSEIKIVSKELTASDAK